MSKLSVEIKKETLLLYKYILRSHLNYLKEDLRVFGDFFVKSEFQLHYQNSDTEQMKVFLAKWKLYYDILEKEKNINNIKPNPVLYTKLDIDQMKTLNNLKETIEK